MEFLTHSKPKFSGSDAQLILSKTLSHLKDSVGTDILFCSSGNGIITLTAAKKKINEIVYGNGEHYLSF